MIQEIKKTEFYEKIETFGTALANQSFSIRIKKSELISSLEFDKNLKNIQYLYPHTLCSSDDLIAGFDLEI